MIIAAEDILREESNWSGLQWEEINPNDAISAMIKYAEQFIDEAIIEYKNSSNHSGVLERLNKLKEKII